jgi:hypothetical protein
MVRKGADFITSTAAAFSCVVVMAVCISNRRNPVIWLVERWDLECKEV